MSRFAVSTACAIHDGSFRLIRDQGVILADEQGEPANMIGAMRDVTAQRQAEVALREATELHRVAFRLPSPAMQVDAQGTYLDADDRALAFFERTRDETPQRRFATTSRQKCRPR